MAEADGSVRIKSELDTSGFSKGLQKLHSKHQRQLEALNKQGAVVQNLQKKYNDFLNGITKTSEELGIIKQIREVETEISKLDKKIQSKKFELLPESKQARTKSLLSDYKASLRELQAEQSNLQKTMANTDSMKKLAGDIELAGQRYQRLRQEVRSTEQEISRIGGSKISNFFGKIFSGVGSAFERMKNQSKGVGSAIGGITTRLLNMAKTMFIFNLLNKGFQHLRDAIGGLIQQDSALVRTCFCS